ncbi:dicarboxylate/amino acid:cation symporter [Marinomonas sp. GJ51-6]|uniref:dicarboxylate/amino acid:cation symporter n=1 Tax=Marinomonas sp. GJ51-6 TaxID=2992802 RepID=UPI002934E082|nr:cation:dicarboxylase symporter family transporter [Marinomonas sp. GJ51-6]WOD09050.1 cation:dicarboxylase symporter family transporter [Marinomonas sp. GJ51-6]
MNTTFKVLLGMALGIVVGLIINLTGLNSPGTWANSYLTNGLFHIVGSMFVNALKMLVVPLVFFSLVCGVCGIGDIKLLGKIGSKSFVLYLFTTAIAIASALLIAAGLGIGEGMNAVADTTFSGREAPPLSSVLVNIIPSNPINAMAKGDMLPVIFFSILFGVSTLLVGKKAESVSGFIETLNDIMMKMVGVIMAVAPYAVFCLIAKAIANLGMDLLAQLLGYVLVLIGVLLFHLFVTLQLMLKVFSGLRLTDFYQKNAQCSGVCF